MCVRVCARMRVCYFQDGLLSIDEIMDKLDTVKISTITDYGTLLLNKHEEL